MTTTLTTTPTTRPGRHRAPGIVPHTG
jgi:hypothetical protein